MGVICDPEEQSQWIACNNSTNNTNYWIHTYTLTANAINNVFI